MADKTNGKFIFIVQQHHHGPLKSPISILMTIYVFDPAMTCFLFPLSSFGILLGCGRSVAIYHQGRYIALILPLLTQKYLSPNPMF